MKENNLVLNHTRPTQPTRHGTVLEVNGGPELTTCFPFARTSMSAVSRVAFGWVEENKKREECHF